MTAVAYQPSTSSSAAGVIAYLEEDDILFKVRALQKLYQVIDVHWAEICESLPVIEALSEDETFPAAHLAAAIASKCFYHLQEYNDALRLALSAGEYFDVSARNEYIETMLSHCIDEYKNLRQEKELATPIDPRMEAIIEQMFQRCYRDRYFEQALGVALDTHRLDKVAEVVDQAIAAGKDSILGYAFSLCQSARNVTPREFRLGVIEVLVTRYTSQTEKAVNTSDKDYTNVIFGLQYLDRSQDAARTLDKLLRGSEDEALLALQIAFDLLETENQGFMLRVVRELSGASGLHTAMTEGAAATTSADDSDKLFQERLAKLKRILLEGLDVDLYLSFLHHAAVTHVDPSILRDLKVLTDGPNGSRNGAAVLHNATVMCHALLHLGTARDGWLRDNLEWLGKAKNWAKFSAVASIGMVHKGHVHESMTLLQPYLPSGGASTSPYSESGALYALGLIHANKGGAGDSKTITYLSEALRNGGNNEIVQHGACLGIGLAAMGTANEELFESLRAVLFADSAVAGEGAALGIGLLTLGQVDGPLVMNALPDLLNYLHDTQHEKIIRALSLSVAMMVYGKEESADVIIEQLSRDRDPIVRYGACFAVAMAYCGTSDNQSLRKLLHIAVSDVSDDVRRAAVMAIGFLMFRNPETVPKLVALLAESFNPHVRYGACLAVGIACAGTAQKDAIDLLTPLLEDGVDFVRQGAMISLAMVLQQAAEARSPSVRRCKEHCQSVAQDKHQPIVAKQGAIIALGMLEAGAGNVAVSLAARAGFLKAGACVGMMLFLQHWYWYPLLPAVSLALQPTAIIGLNADLNMPKGFSLLCSAPPSTFAYLKWEEKKEEEKKPMATAVLSTTAKAKAREAKKEAKKHGGVGRQISSQMSIEKTASVNADDKDKDLALGGIPLERVTSHLSTVSYLSVDADPKAQAAAEKAKKLREPTSFTVPNVSRVVPAQWKFLSLPPDQRYRPVRGGHRTALAGILLLQDGQPGEAEEVQKVEKLGAFQESEMAPAPEPFEWDPNDE